MGVYLVDDAVLVLVHAFEGEDELLQVLLVALELEVQDDLLERRVLDLVLLLLVHDQDLLLAGQALPRGVSEE